MDKFTIFREMLDYMAHIGKVTDADMNCYVVTSNTMSITCETDDEVITLEVTARKKEAKNDA